MAAESGDGTTGAALGDAANVDTAKVVAALATASAGRVVVLAGPGSRLEVIQLEG